MLKPRLIPVLLYKSGVLVRSRTFSFHQSTGDPLEQVKRFADWKADELIYLDISRDSVYDTRLNTSIVGSTSSQKEDAAYRGTDFVGIVDAIAAQCTIPLTVGGKVATIEDIRRRLKYGADKVAINSQALRDPAFLTEAAETFGSQCVVASIDVRYDEARSNWGVYADAGKTAMGLGVVEWCREVEGRGAGEILLQSIDRDGMGVGYDLALLRTVAEAVSIPVIALGGVGTFKHLFEGLGEGRANAVAAANIFHFTEHSIIKAKEYLCDAGVDVRL